MAHVVPASAGRDGPLSFRLKPVLHAPYTVLHAPYTAFRPYVILGVCNPSLAYQTLQQEIDIGLLLPCNVIAYEQDGQSVVAAIDAQKMMTIVGNPQLEQAASAVSERLRRVIDSL